MSDTEPVVRVTQQEQIKLIHLNRPDRHNALNFDMATAITAAIDQAEADENTHVVVITGDGGKAFCAGQDMLEQSGVVAAAGEVKSSSAAIAFERVAACELPVIAAITGICYGGGALLALACDLRIADTQSTYRFPGAEYGLVVGAAWLPRLVGASKAKEWIFTARKITADEALANGLVSYLHPSDKVLGAAVEMAQEISANAPRAVAESKRIIEMASLDSDAEIAEDAINEILRGSEEQRARFNQATTRVTGVKV
ncbi:MAG: enoyl-CoA hydratase/isomerase family protein, partial [Pseudomonadota bacterium]